MHPARYFIIALTLTALVAACGEDPTGTGPNRVLTGGEGLYVEGTAWSLSDSTPLVDATAVLVEGVPYVVVAGPVRTDSTGYFVFHDPPPGDYYLIVFTGDHLMEAASDAIVHVRAGEPLSLDLGMIRSAIWSNQGARAEGTVTDAVTGKPIAGAYVSSTFGYVGYPLHGIPVNGEGVTDSTGHYSVVLVNVFTGTRVVSLLGISKEGYAPFSRELGILASDSTLPLDVALESETATGVITGRVLQNGMPASGVPVGVDYAAEGLFPPDASSAKGSGNPDRVPLLGKSTISGFDGRFTLEGLAAGDYTIECGYLPDDGYAPISSSYAQVRLAEGENASVGDMEVAVAPQPVYPQPGSMISNSTPTFRWRPVPGAQSYVLYAGAGHQLDAHTVNTNSWTPSTPLPTGMDIRWTVRAYREIDNYIVQLSSFDSVVKFQVAPE